jgi:hypothetical protein
LSQAFATGYARRVTRFLGIPASKRLVLGLSVGCPDVSSSVNKFRTGRAGKDEIVKWLD